MTDQPSASSSLRAQAKVWLFDWREIGGHFERAPDGSVRHWRDVAEGDEDGHRLAEEELLDTLRDDHFLREVVLQLVINEGTFRPFGSVDDA